MHGVPVPLQKNTGSSCAFSCEKQIFQRQTFHPNCMLFSINAFHALFPISFHITFFTYFFADFFAFSIGMDDAEALRSTLLRSKSILKFLCVFHAMYAAFKIRIANPNAESQ